RLVTTMTTLKWPAKCSRSLRNSPASSASKAFATPMASASPFRTGQVWTPSRTGNETKNTSWRKRRGNRPGINNSRSVFAKWSGSTDLNGRPELHFGSNFADLHEASRLPSPCAARAGSRAEEKGSFHRNWNPLSLTLSPLLGRGERESTSGELRLRLEL